MSIVQGALMTMFKAGTTVTGNRTLAGVSSAVVFFTASGDCMISGAGLT